MILVNFLSSALILLLAVPSFAQEKVKPFVIHEKSQFMRADIKKDKKATANVIVFEVGNLSGGTGTIRGEVLPPAQISSVDVLQGGFLQKQRLTARARGEIIQFTEVVYPFRARFTMVRTTAISSSEDLIDLEFIEPGTYRVKVSMSQ